MLLFGEEATCMPLINHVYAIAEACVEMSYRGCLLLHQVSHTDFTKCVEDCHEKHLKQLAHALVHEWSWPQDSAYNGKSSTAQPISAHASCLFV